MWEQGLNRSMLQRALVFLAVAFPEKSPDEIAGWSIGSRDACLLMLRERLFGARLVNNAICPRCQNRVEWEHNIEDLIVEAVDYPVGHQFSLETDGYLICFRLPNSMDMALVESCNSTSDALGLLLMRCILSSEYKNAFCGIDELPGFVIRALNRRIEELDPQAEIRIQLTCPECANGWEVFFDITGFLWTEINEWALHMLQTVHKLACVYGWTEREILGLSPVRRQLYLGMAGA